MGDSLAGLLGNVNTAGPFTPALYSIEENAELSTLRDERIGSHLILCYYQSEKKTEYRLGRYLPPSHSSGIKNYNKWSHNVKSKWFECEDLNYFATTQFQSPIYKNEYVAFTRKNTEQLRYMARKHSVEISGIRRLEVDRANMFHIHWGIRTPLDRETIEALFCRATYKASQKVFNAPLAYASYFEPIESSEAVKVYMAKVGQGNKQLLFKPEMRMRIVERFGGYYK